MIQLTERDLKYIIKESISRYLITENQESASQHDAMKLAMQHGMDEKRAKQFVRIDLRNDIPSLKDKKGAKFTLGVARMYFDRQIQDAQTINKLDQTIKLLSSAHYNEYDRNLNGLSAQELIERFKSAILANIDKDREELAKIQFQKNDNYNIISINSYEEAQQYYKYTYEGSPWCLTHMENMFDNYTCNGINQLYFCFRKGFENEKPVEGEGCPLDSYGTSMISVIVNENGSLAYSTCRWNHKNGGSDSVLTTRQISELIGENFYNVFKPNHKWQDMIDSVKQRLANGENPKDIFDEVDNFYDGFAYVVLNNKLNYIDIKGNILSDTWFEDGLNFRDGFAAVELNNRWNFVDKEGNILYGNPNNISTGFDWVEDFYNGFARVELKHRFNYIDTKGNIIYGDPNDTNTWFDWANGFYNNKNFAMVKLKHKIMYIDTEGNLYDENKNPIKL